MTSPITALVVGANRGLGLQLVKDLSELHTGIIFATYRSEDQSKDLLELASTNQKVRAIQLDARDEAKYPEVVKVIDDATKGSGLNLLINNAGIYSQRPQTLESMTKETLMLHFEVNTVAPLLLVKALLPLLEKGANSNSGPLGINRAAVVNMSSLMGSVEDNGSGGDYAYRSSKSALNMVTKSLSLDLIDKNIVSVVLHPGWVKTDMGGRHATLSIEDSVRGMVQVISSLEKSQNGKFLRYNGDVLPW